jgi:hypothetical protein
VSIKHRQIVTALAVGGALLATVVVVVIVLFVLVLGVERTLTAGERATAVSRVVTVAQRCDLTSEVRAIDLLDGAVLTAAHDPKAAAFALHARTLAVSYAGCEKQLAAVKASLTPAP